MFKEKHTFKETLNLVLKLYNENKTKIKENWEKSVGPKVYIKSFDRFLK